MKAIVVVQNLQLSRSVSAWFGNKPAIWRSRCLVGSNEQDLVGGGAGAVGELGRVHMEPDSKATRLLNRARRRLSGAPRPAEGEGGDIPAR
jgi:hypothetical protein